MAERPMLRRLDHTTLADQAYDTIREAIISGELASTAKITERGLAERLAVSPTPVREALRRLEQEGLVHRAGPRTVQVADFEAESAKEVRLAAGALRTVAARLAAANATAEQLVEMERCLDAGDRALARLEARPASDALTRADLAPLLARTREFHDSLEAACNNPVILRLLRTVDAFGLASRPATLTAELGHDGGRAALERYREHRALYESVRSGDAIGAERSMAAHVRADELTPF